MAEKHRISTICGDRIGVSMGFWKVITSIWGGIVVPQDETWTNLNGPSWIQYDLFRKKLTTGVQKGKFGQVYASTHRFK